MQRKINGKPLSEDILLTPPDLGAASNPNLVINGYFPDPVNQLGLEEYTAPGCHAYYGIDQWGQYNKTRLTISEDGASLFYPGEADGGTYILGQAVEDFKALRGGTMTLSLLVSSLSQGEIDLFVQFHEDYEGNIDSDITSDAGLLSVTFQVPMDAEMMLFGINSPNKNPCAFSPVAMKLEPGPFQTLAHQDATGNWVLNDPPPNKALELAKCQRYQFELFDRRLTGQGYVVQGKAISGTHIYGLLPTPVPMREGGLPALITDCSADNPYFSFGVFKDGYSGSHPITSMWVYSRQENGIIINAEGSNFVPGNDYQIFVGNQNQHQFLLDRNL